jgi:hypothetical protein
LEKSALKKKNLEDKVQIQKTKEKSKNNRYPLKPIYYTTIRYYKVAFRKGNRIIMGHTYLKEKRSCIFPFL